MMIHVTAAAKPGQNGRAFSIMKGLDFLLDFDDNLDLDRDAVWQRAHADG